MSDRETSDSDRELSPLRVSSSPWTPELSVLTHLAPGALRRRRRSRLRFLSAIMWGVAVGLVGWAGLWWLLAPEVLPAEPMLASAPTPPPAVLQQPLPELQPTSVEAVPSTPPEPAPVPEPVARDTARPSAASEIVVRAILVSEARALAMVDEQIVGVGDVVKGLVVVDIQADGIVVRNNAGEDTVVSIYPARDGAEDQG